MVSVEMTEQGYRSRMKHRHFSGMQGMVLNEMFRRVVIFPSETPCIPAPITGINNFTAHKCIGCAFVSISPEKEDIKTRKSVFIFNSFFLELEVTSQF